MNKIVPKREWDILNFEIFKNKPLRTIFSKHIVKKRELLLFAQCCLADYQSARSKKFKNFFGELYQKIMDVYFAW